VIKGAEAAAIEWIMFHPVVGAPLVQAKGIFEEGFRKTAGHNSIACERTFAEWQLSYSYSGGSSVEFVQSVKVRRFGWRHVCITSRSLLSQLFYSRMGPSTNSSKSRESGSALLSNVFGFFSREIESFVVNAAGGSAQASHDHKQVQHQILIHTPQQPPEPGSSHSSPNPKRVKKKPRRVNGTAYAIPPDPKRGKGPKEDQRGSKPLTNQRSHHTDKPDAVHVQNTPGEHACRISQ
jgi:hypothetical protein